MAPTTSTAPTLLELAAFALALVGCPATPGDLGEVSAGGTGGSSQLSSSTGREASGPTSGLGAESTTVHGTGAAPTTGQALSDSGQASTATSLAQETEAATDETASGSLQCQDFLEEVYQLEACTQALGECDRPIEGIPCCQLHVRCDAGVVDRQISCYDDCDQRCQRITREFDCRVYASWCVWIDDACTTVG